MSMRKAPGPDDITTEMLVAAGGRGVTQILKNLANMMYSEGHFPEQMYTSIFITIPKVKDSQMREASHNKFNAPCNKTSSEGDNE